MVIVNSSSKYIIFALLSSLFFVSCLYARKVDILYPDKVENNEGGVTGDFYDLDYEPSTTLKENGVWDPWEKMNRKLYNFNEFFLQYFAKPLYYEVYLKITTPGIRKSIHNVVMNFRMPVIFVNYVLQLDFDNAARTIYSFALNSTYGILGIYDLSGYQGVTPPATDLGITLAKYHVPSGPYIILPFLGPNDARGLISWGTELATDPFGYNIFKIGGKSPLLENWILWARSSLFVIDNTSYAIENFYDLIESSFDPYIMMRDAYEQSQEYKINKARSKK